VSATNLRNGALPELDPLQAIILGIVQGITELLPISSSGHLILFPWLLGWDESTLTFDVALHGGTAAAIVIYFWRDWVALISAFFASLRDRDFTSTYHRRLPWYIALATLPAALVGVFFEDIIEELLRSPLVVGVFLIAFGLLLMVADRTSSRNRTISDITLRDALLVGVAQAFALMPGVSRSGITITAGLFRNISRHDAARFSFLLGTPVTVGAFLYKMMAAFQQGFPQEELIPFVLGIAAAAVVGLGAIRFLLTYVQKHSLAIFVYYRFALGAVVILLFLLRGF
jgi:undecaprenyl-diphosphatase